MGYYSGHSTTTIYIDIFATIKQHEAAKERAKNRLTEFEKGNKKQ